MCMRLWNTVLSSSVMWWGKGNSGNLNSYQVALALKKSGDFVRKIAWLQNRTEIKPNNNGKPKSCFKYSGPLGFFLASCKVAEVGYAVDDLIFELIQSTNSVTRV